MRAKSTPVGSESDNLDSESESDNEFFFAKYGDIIAFLIVLTVSILLSLSPKFREKMRSNNNNNDNNNNNNRIMSGYI